MSPRRVYVATRDSSSRSVGIVLIPASILAASLIFGALDVNRQRQRVTLGFMRTQFLHAMPALVSADEGITGVGFERIGLQQPEMVPLPAVKHVGADDLR